MECLEPDSDLIPDANSEAMSCAEVLGSSSKALFDYWAIMFLIASSLVDSCCDLPNHFCSCKMRLHKKFIQPVSPVQKISPSTGKVLLKSLTQKS